MSKLHLLIVSALFSVFSLFPLTGSAQSKFNADYPIFESTAEVDKIIVDLTSTLKIDQLLVTVSGDQSVTAQNRAIVQQQLSALFPRKIKNHAVLIERESGEGFREKIDVFWADKQYLFTQTITHERDDGVIVMEFIVNTSLSQIKPYF
ncbi:hypothetical protein [Celeribacter sp. SCSIO 80788]|uniref:hypothetical protein n=1 Tax=Celeribacter sp. SCSIO 80788 TaxID=3117013 RepID=UPI003DA38913